LDRFEAVCECGGGYEIAFTGSASTCAEGVLPEVSACVAAPS
jgi:hypothetical protein